MQEAERAFDAVVALIQESGAEPVIIGPASDAELEATFASCQASYSRAVATSIRSFSVHRPRILPFLASMWRKTALTSLSSGTA